MRVIAIIFEGGTTITKAELKDDWLFTSAIVALIAALLMGQVWEPSEGTFRLPFFFDIPAYDRLAVLSIVAGMLALSIVLAAASVIPRFRDCALGIGSHFATILGFIVWVAFIISFGSSFPELPDQWWSSYLVIVGVVFLIFIPIRAVLRIVRSRK